jgi:hypothetical protein
LESSRVPAYYAVDNGDGTVARQVPAGGTRPTRARHRRSEQDGRPQHHVLPTGTLGHDHEETAHLVLPVPPHDTEKLAYVRRHAWVLTLCSVLTFPPLVFSQVRLFIDSPWFLLYAPFMVLGTLTFGVSLLAPSRP